ncbi:uncharacterized protein LOC5509216 isoform X3 [Nematostella vectensis]|uniref:uncharacterized protein LOC5509216 isoform X3 n=1 Tax=Nematostella vectensis TaxID=45351 RepID=UPI002077834F|nr:uncharacterized protein LOC5509216 isoform X3 [Nematostella vectensis]
MVFREADSVLLYRASSPHWKRIRRSSFEGFFASKGAAFSIPDGDFARKASKHGGEMQVHLQSMVNLLRDNDVLRLVVKLETKYYLPGKVRYLAVVSSFSLDDIEESVVLGIDWVDESATIGLVLPLWRDTAIELDGDGGFELSTNSTVHFLKPVSVQTMWTAFQWIHKCSDNARRNNQYPAGTSHSWVKYYENQISSDQTCIKEWFETEENLKIADDSVGISKEDELLRKLLRHKLREVMMTVDLEEVTSRQVRELVEAEVQMDLKQYKQYIDKEMLTIFGQMDSASKIYDHVYLGSEWNASNLEELKENGVEYVLNITKEIDNFFAGTFTYFNIRLWDLEDSNLLPYWDETFKFINQARDKGSKVLVHCKRGISRSASTVIAYGMKEYGTSLNDTMKHVKSRRQCVNPNQGFWKQLITYEGILNSSRHRYNELFNNNKQRSNSEIIRETKRKRRRHGRHKHSTITTTRTPEVDMVINKTKRNSIERDTFGDIITEDSVGEGESDDGGSAGFEDDDEEEEEDGSIMMMRFLRDTSSGDDVFYSWETEDIDSTTPVRSSTPDPDHIGIKEDQSIVNKGEKRRPIHRTNSSPMLRKKVKRKSHKKTLDNSELDRCQSLREMLTGRVAALREDLQGNKGRSTGVKIAKTLSTESAEETCKAGETIEEPVPEREIQLVPLLNEKNELFINDGDEEIFDTGLMEGETPDVGSSEDLHQNVDAHGLSAVKTGTVKRQSRNFEEGKVNLPWEWEKMGPDPASEPKEVITFLLKETTGVQGAPVPEVDPGVVRKHASALEKKYLGVQERESKLSGSDSEIDHGSTESPVSIPPKKLIIPETSFAIESVGKTPQVEQGFVGILDTSAVRRKINEDMHKEKQQRRRLSGEQKIQNMTSTAAGNVKAVEVMEPDLGKSKAAVTLKDSDEEPIKGIVRKHAKGFEERHRGLEVGSNLDQDSSQQLNAETLEALPFIKNTKASKYKANQEPEESKDDFDLDLMLLKVSEDKKKQKLVHQSESLEGNITTVAPLEDKAELDPADRDDWGEGTVDEIPRPGTVRRNTELLLGKSSTKEEAKEELVTVSNVNSDLVHLKSAPSREAVPAQHIVENSGAKVFYFERTVSAEAPSPPGSVKRNKQIFEGKREQNADENIILPEVPQNEEIEAGVKDEEEETSKEDSVLSPTGAVKKQTQLFEGKGEFSSGWTKSSKKEPEIIKVAVGEREADAMSKEDSLQGPTGAVRRQTKLFEGKESLESNFKDEPKSDVSKTSQNDLEVLKAYSSEGEEGSEMTKEESVDTSSVVNVKFHLKLLEEIIRSSNAREQHKHRTNKALAAIEEKRSRIDLQRNKKDSGLFQDNKSQVEFEMESLDEDYVFVPDNDEEDDANTSHDDLLDSLSHSAVSLAIENAQKNLDEEETIASSGHVKRRTLLIEEQLREKGSPVRRHVSLPKSTRPEDRPVVRKRSLSDITVKTRE